MSHGSDTCEGFLVNSTDVGKCLCECITESHVSVGVESIIGNVVGVHLTELSIVAYTLIFFTIVVLFFAMIYPIIHHLYMLVCHKLNTWIRHGLSICPGFGFLFSKTNHHDHEEENHGHESLLGHFLVPESGFVIIIGIIIGVIIKVTKLDHELENEIMKFNTELFFLIFTPPILIKMTYFTEKSTLMHNIGMISYYSLVGTIYFTFFLGGVLFYANVMEFSFVECLVLAALLASVDPVPVLEVFHEEKVNHRMHEMIESEAIFKHATSIVLYMLFLNFQLNITNENLHLVGSIFGLGIVRFLVVIVLGALLGFFVGFLGSLFTRFSFRKNMQHYQSLIVYLTCYLGYFVTETFVGIGILGLVTATLFMSRYVKYNLSWKSRNTIKQSLKMAASIAENLLFLYLGISIVDFEHEFNWTCIIVCNVGCLIIRFVFVITTNTGWNLFFLLANKHCEIIPRSDTFIIAFSGVRGALSFALAFVLPNDFEHKNVFVTTALSVIVFTVFVQGTLIGPLVHLLGIEKAHLKIKDKVVEYEKIEKYLRKVLYLIPHPRTVVGVRSVLVKDCNRNYKKALKRTSDFLHKVKRDEKLAIHEKFRERLQQRKKERKARGKEHVNIKEEEEEEEHVEISSIESEEEEELERHPDIEVLTDLFEFLVNDANGFYSDDSMIHPKELSDGYKMREEVHKYVTKLRKRLSELLRYSQYKTSVIKIPREDLELALGIHAVGEIPPEWVDNKIHEEKSVLMKMVKGLIHFFGTLAFLVDKMIQLMVNRKGSKKEVNFTRATINFKSYCLCDYTNQFHHGDEDEIFLEKTEDSNHHGRVVPQAKILEVKDVVDEEEEREVGERKDEKDLNDEEVGEYFGENIIEVIEDPEVGEEGGEGENVDDEEIGEIIDESNTK